MTDIVASATGHPSLADRTWVLIHESPDGGWGIDGHAHTNADIAAAPAASWWGSKGGARCRPGPGNRAGSG